MNTTKELYEQIRNLFEDFEDNHNKNAETGVKVAGTPCKKSNRGNKETCHRVSQAIN